jgi:molybdopterin-guanine dinucleotide biosynthesis protein A
MGRPKVMLPFGPEVMLARVARLLGQAVEPVVVVAGIGQTLPELPPEVAVVHDRRQDCGPLEGLAVGLRAVRTVAEAAFVTACDVPLLRPEFVHRMIELSDGYDIAVPQVDGFDNPLVAVYRTRVLPQVETLLAAGRLRPAFLFDHVPTRRIAAQELTDVDPHLQSLANVNSPADYRAVLAQTGFGGQECR